MCMCVCVCLCVCVPCDAEESNPFLSVSGIQEHHERYSVAVHGMVWYGVVLVLSGVGMR
jgi:hypothetical protein